jgi:hypothetical protein
MIMFCPNCKCEFVGWTGRCPNCKVTLLDKLPQDYELSDEGLTYEELVDLVKDKDGLLEIVLTTSSVEKERKWRFPYDGYGYAWARKMVGESDGIVVELQTTNVGKDRAYRFPYVAYGFAWMEGSQGQVAGHEVELKATKVAREKKWRFPFFGYGRAWTEEMHGECGDQLYVHLSITDIGKSREYGFPYKGFGFAWEKSGILKLSLKE